MCELVGDCPTCRNVTTLVLKLVLPIFFAIIGVKAMNPLFDYLAVKLKILFSLFHILRRIEM